MSAVKLQSLDLSIFRINTAASWKLHNFEIVDVATRAISTPEIHPRHNPAVIVSHTCALLLTYEASNAATPDSPALVPNCRHVNQPLRVGERGDCGLESHLSQHSTLHFSWGKCKVSRWHCISCRQRICSVRMWKKNDATAEFENAPGLKLSRELTLYVGLMHTRCSHAMQQTCKDGHTFIKRATSPVS